jgi:hypothetical protein
MRMTPPHYGKYGIIIYTEDPDSDFEPIYLKATRRQLHRIKAGTGYQHETDKILWVNINERCRVVPMARPFPLAASYIVLNYVLVRGVRPCMREVIESIISKDINCII